MPKVQIVSGASFDVGAQDTVVRAALRAGIGFPYECNSGSCGTCKFTLLEGEVEDLQPDSPALSERDRKKGRKLACQCLPLTDLSIKVFEDDEYIPKFKPKRLSAKLIDIKPVTHNIYSFKFKVEQDSCFLAGQYSLIELPDVGERAYSMSNLDNTDGVLEFLIKKVPGGKVSVSLFELDNTVPLSVSIDGPYGIAHIRDNNRDRICIAGGSGLAPMVSIARQHIMENSKNKLIFIFGGQKNEDVLTEDEFRLMVGDDRGVIEYIAAVSNDEPKNNYKKGYLNEVLMSELGEDLSSNDIYCAGPPALTNALEQMLHSNAFPVDQLYFDRFN